MSRIPTPPAIEGAPAKSQPLLAAVKAQLGVAPNMYRLVGVSPAALEGLLGLSGALAKSAIRAATRERIALAVANVNGCTYCNSAHTYLAQNAAKLNEVEIAANRAGGSTDPDADAAVKFAVKVARQRGALSEADVAAARAAGLSDAALIDIVGLVALNVFTNYINETFKTDVDFPVVEARRAA
jgi:uncharacterized peroxidase-related enzyme